MLLGVVFILVLLSVPLARGRLSALGDLRLRMPGLAVAGILAQVLIVSVAPSGLGGVQKGVHLLSYALLGACAWANRRVPGVPLIALGGLSNVIAIAANGGVMPLDPALVVHTVQEGGHGFVNSGVVQHPRLLFLGDIFATPRDWPMANVYSIGDFTILLGVAVLVHRVSGSRLVAWWPRRTAPAPRTAADRRAAAERRAAARLASGGRA
jgi:Family of unknown function (DUF5317)